MADEKVLDVTAIDMTDAALAKRKPTKRAARTTSKRDGSIGRATFEAVNKLIADGSMTKQSAFVAYGKQTKTQPGTVGANYYRVARAEGAVKPRTRRVAAASGVSNTDVVSAKPTRAPRPRASASTGLDATLATLVTSIEDLAVALKQEQAEKADLRRRLDGQRALV